MSEKINVVDELKAVTRKTAAAIHDYLRSISLPDQDKPILIAGVIIALEDKDFRETYQGIGRANKFVKYYKGIQIILSKKHKNIRNKLKNQGI